jgi:sugar lactone lactonase YvrE
VGSFGGNGRYAGQLHWIDSIAMDSKGNVYTGEVEDGKRIQKFSPTNWAEVSRARPVGAR